MLSILIPTYNYDAYPLAKEASTQAIAAKIDFELICIDDGSHSPENLKNEQINALKNSIFFAHDKNLGRSGIRNFLAEKATYENLLFLDSDVEIFDSKFLSTYLEYITQNTEIIYGGIIYQKEKPLDSQLLRWVYGNEREALSLNQRIKNPHLTFLTLNFVIKKALFKKIRFNEDMPNLRNEDLVYAMDAKKAGVTVTHIDNPVIHLGIEDSKIFLSKTKETLQSFRIIIKNGFLEPQEALITRVAQKIQNLKLAFVFKIIWVLLKGSFTKNLLSKKPSLFIFDLYRLCYYLQLKSDN